MQKPRVYRSSSYNGGDEYDYKWQVAFGGTYESFSQWKDAIARATSLHGNQVYLRGELELAGGELRKAFTEAWLCASPH